MNMVSVIIPAYNKADFTCRAVESVLNQTYKNIELIVVDDGSTDDTRQRLSVYADRIQYIYKDNGGACSARNLGMRHAKGDLIGFLDCDDMYAVNKVELGVEYLNSHPEAGFIHTAAYFIEREDQVVSTYSHRKSRHQGWISRRLIFGNYICNSTVMVRRSCLDTVGLFDESIFTPADWDLCLRLAERYRVGYINIPLTKYRVSDNYIFNRLELAQKEELVVVTNYCRRNSFVSERFKDRVLSYLHLRFAECYFIKDDEQRMNSEFRQAFALCPWNLKAFGLFFLFFFARRPLKTFLRSKVLRYEIKSTKSARKKFSFTEQRT